MNRYKLPMPAKRLLPHRPPMLCVQTLQSWSDDEATALFTVEEPALLAMDTGVLEFYIEMVAQTAALHSGYEALSEGREPPPGMLVGTEKFKVKAHPKLGDLLQIEISKGFAFGTVHFIEGRVLNDKDVYAGGTIKVWVENEK